MTDGAAVETGIQKRASLPHVHFAEPVVINGTYALNLTMENNPIFYGLAQKIIDAIGPTATDPQVIAAGISKLTPPVDHDMGTYKGIVKQAARKNTIPIDAFFDPQNPTPYCFERSILSQLIFAHYGFETKIKTLKGLSKTNPPHLHHRILELNHRGKKIIIESTSLGKNPVQLIEKERYLQTFSGSFTEIKELDDGDDVFYPKKN